MNRRERHKIKGASAKHVKKEKEKEIKKHDTLLNRSAYFEKKLKLLRNLFTICLAALIIVAINLITSQNPRPIYPLIWILGIGTAALLGGTLHYHRKLKEALEHYRKATTEVLMGFKKNEKKKSDDQETSE